MNISGLGLDIKDLVTFGGGRLVVRCGVPPRPMLAPARQGRLALPGASPRTPGIFG